MLLKCARCTWGLNHKTCKTLYNGAIQPMLLYAASNWGHVTSKNSVASNLLSLQKQFALRISRFCRTVSTNASLILAELLPLSLCIVEKILNYYIRTTSIKAQQWSLLLSMTVHMTAQILISHCNYPTISDHHPVNNVIPREHLVSSASSMDNHADINIYTDGSKSPFMSVQVSVSSSKLTCFAQNMLEGTDTPTYQAEEDTV
ncbi:uncharacterized protein LOC111642628 [Centruroides sculpturatus]|uniref:uncharacterized protein LOC111642628 n=1 Tax=Centruroides sculpturatus TaxID=218467 RepID=UPI000C6C9AA1|nr:uncharacterized protein LOC111642628 [Centruroides sculpturatus]